MDSRWVPVLLAWAVLCFPAFSETPWPPVVSFALYENGYLYNTKEDRGIDKDVFREVARRLGITVQFSVMPRARIWLGLENHTLMATGSGIETPDRDKFAWFVPYIYQKNYVVFLKKIGSPGAQGFLDDKTLNWGVVRGYVHGPEGNHFVDSLRAQNRLIEAADQDELYRLLQNGMVSGIFGPVPIYVRYLKEDSMESLVNTGDWFPQETAIPGGLVLSREFFRTDQVVRVKKTIEAMENDGTLLKIYTSYLGADGEKLLTP